MRRAAYLLAAVLVLGIFPRGLLAQIYNPRTIRFESSDPARALDAMELLRVSGLRQGVSVSKAEIEAALQKLGESGEFTDLSYTVNDAALTIKLTAAAEGQPLPVLLTNFVWWSESELLALLKERVPLFHGTLPLQGEQTAEVEKALVALLSEKGIPDAKVTAAPAPAGHGSTTDSVALSVASPEIETGEIQFQGTVPGTSEKLTRLAHNLTGHIFNLQEMNTQIRVGAKEIFAEVGYLDARIDSPVVTLHHDLAGYVVDVKVNLNPGPLYHVSAIFVHPAEPVTQQQILEAISLKPGDPASVADVRNTVTALTRLYGEHSYLRSKAMCDITKNRSDHTVAYTFEFEPGPQYRFASIDATALPSDAQQELAALWHSEPGTLVDRDFQLSLRDALQKLHIRSGIAVYARRNEETHTATIILQPRTVASLDSSSP